MLQRQHERGNETNHQQRAAEAEQRCTDAARYIRRTGVGGAVLAAAGGGVRFSALPCAPCKRSRPHQNQSRNGVEISAARVSKRFPLPQPPDRLLTVVALIRCGKRGNRAPRVESSGGEKKLQNRPTRARFQHKPGAHTADETSRRRRWRTTPLLWSERGHRRIVQDTCVQALCQIATAVSRVGGHRPFPSAYPPYCSN